MIQPGAGDDVAVKHAGGEFCAMSECKDCSTFCMTTGNSFSDVAAAIQKNRRRAIAWMLSVVHHAFTRGQEIFWARCDARVIAARSMCMRGFFTGGFVYFGFEPRISEKKMSEDEIAWGGGEGWVSSSSSSSGGGAGGKRMCL